MCLLSKSSELYRLDLETSSLVLGGQSSCLYPALARLIATSLSSDTRGNCKVAGPVDEDEKEGRPLSSVRNRIQFQKWYPLHE